MTELPFRPSNATEFDRLMGDYVWQDHSEPAADGGIICCVSQWYNDWHDAILTATRLGAKRLWSSRLRDENGYYFQFPDGSRIWINTSGSQLVLSRKARL
jgi:hypothetical protein